MKNKAYTLFELVVVMAILLVVTGVTGLSLSNYSEKKDSQIITEDLSFMFRIMGSEASNKNERIDISFDHINKLINFKKKGNIISTFYLPKRYSYSNNGGTNIHFTETGNISPMFTFEVKENNIGFYKLVFISTDKFVQTAKIKKKMFISNIWKEIE